MRTTLAPLQLALVRTPMPLSSKIILSVKPNHQKGLFAAAAIAADEVLLTYDGPLIDHPTRLSIQIDDDKHIEGTDGSNAFLNHGCNPNAYVDWTNLCLRARRTIASGEEVTCNYFTTDYELHTTFVCHCGAAECKGEIRGFKYLSREEQEELKPWLPPFLKRKIGSKH